MKKQQSAKWLRTQQHSDTFHLFQLTKSFFGPLEELLGDKKYLLSEDEPTDVDCITVGYLSLMRYASLPQPWLAGALRTRFPKLHAYTERMYKETFENPQRPWRSRLSKAPPPNASQSAYAMGRSALEWALPFLKQTITQDPSRDRSEYQKPAAAEKSVLSTLLSPAVLLPLGALASAALGVAKYMSISNSRGKHTFRAEERDVLSPTKLIDLGESGAMLSALSRQFDLETQYERERDRAGGNTLVEVDVENEKGEVGKDIIVER
jgi:sorting and assembly machinery component 37